MSSTSSRLSRQALEQIAQRNAAVEISRADGTQAHHCRLLSISSDDSLLIERPALADVQTLLAVGTPVRLIVNHQGQRWEDRRVVLGEQRFALNDAIAVNAVRLSRASQVTSGQRRQFFRAGTGVSEVKVTLLPDTDRSHYTADDGGELEPLVPTTVNISGGGVGVRLDASREMMQKLFKSRVHRCQIQLSAKSAPIEVRTRLIHVEPMPGGVYYLGLEFQFDTPGEREHIQDQIARFTTDVQRQQIRRQRRQ